MSDNISDRLLDILKAIIDRPEDPRTRVMEPSGPPQTQDPRDRVMAPSGSVADYYASLGPGPQTVEPSGPPTQEDPRARVMAPSGPARQIDPTLLSLLLQQQGKR